jgi:transposase InsO family protein
MPWRECDVVSERMIFISRLLSGETMTDLCEEFGVSRKTGYKIFKRYQAEGLQALNNQSRAPRNRPNKTPALIENAIIELREKHQTWGARKIKSVLERTRSGVPACSTIQVILERHNLVKKMKPRRSFKPAGTDLRATTQANELWCVDFKGQFKMANQKYCYPLTTTDHMSRYLVGCEGFESISEEQCMDAFDELFKEFGLPQAIRTDNGVPFGSKSYFGISRLSLRWVRYGIKLERIKPGCPEQNGRHERMHRVLKAEATDPKENLLQQQELLESFREVYNHERPHEALEMKTPAQLYKKSPREMPTFLEPLCYPDHDETRRVSRDGSLRLAKRKRIYIGQPFIGENVGLKQVDDEVWKLTFMNYDLGFYDGKHPVIEIATNPFLPLQGSED